MWRSAEALFGEDTPLRIWNRSEIEPHTNRIKEWVPKRKRPPNLTHPNRLKTHCPKGHPYNEANTYRRRDGRGRECKQCRHDRKDG